MTWWVPAASSSSARTLGGCCCAQIGGDGFFPSLTALGEVAAAKRVCAGCPVRAECLADTLAWEQPTRRFGIAGGLTPTERQRLHLAQRPGGEVA